MKVLMYMATSVNGYIAKGNGDTPWSKEEWASFSKFVKKYKNIVVGRRTYELMRKENDFRKLGNPLVVVVSHSDFLDPDVIFAHSPKDALDMIRAKKLSTAVIAGGAILNCSFMKEKLIHEMYLDVEPLVFGRGVRLFSEGDFGSKLNLLGIKKLSKNTFQLHYRVLN